MESVDVIDLHLIRFLQEHPRASYAMIARATDVSETTVRRRVESLIEANTLTPAMLPDLYALGFRASAMVGLKVDLARVDAIAEQIRDFPEVTFVAVTMGRIDILFFVAQPTLDALKEFLVERVAGMEGVRDTETYVTPRVLKVLGNWRVPIEAALCGLQAGDTDEDGRAPSRPRAVAASSERSRRRRGRGGVSAALPTE